MRLSVWKRAFVSGAVAVGVAVGTLAGTSATAAAAPTDNTPAVAAADVTPQAVENLGLTTRQAKGVQRRLKEFGYDPGAIDGQLGPNSWKAMQRGLRQLGYTGPIDGIVGPNTIKALQRAMKHWGYTGPIDGIAGPGTRAAFARFANYCVNLYGY